MQQKPAFHPDTCCLLHAEAHDLGLAEGKAECILETLSDYGRIPLGELLKEMGQRMLDRRKQLKLTQEALAKMAHVTPQTVSTAELGTKAMRPETMLKICDALDISTDYLLRGQVVEGDTRLLNQKVSSLTPCQYRHLENIIDNFIAAIQEEKEV